MLDKCVRLHHSAVCFALVFWKPSSIFFFIFCPCVVILPVLGCCGLHCRCLHPVSWEHEYLIIPPGRGYMCLLPRFRYNLFVPPPSCCRRCFFTSLCTRFVVICLLYHIAGEIDYRLSICYAAIRRLCYLISAIWAAVLQWCPWVLLLTCRFVRPCSVPSILPRWLPGYYSSLLLIFLLCECFRLQF